MMIFNCRLPGAAVECGFVSGWPLGPVTGLGVGDPVKPIGGVNIGVDTEKIIKL